MRKVFISEDTLVVVLISAMVDRRTQQDAKNDLSSGGGRKLRTEKRFAEHYCREYSAKSKVAKLVKTFLDF